MTVMIPLTTIKIVDEPSDAKKSPLLPLRKELSSLVSRFKMPNFVKSVAANAYNGCRRIGSRTVSASRRLNCLNGCMREALFIIRVPQMTFMLSLLALLLIGHIFCALTRINADISISDSYETPTNITIEYRRLAWSKAAHLEFPVQINATSEEEFRLKKIFIHAKVPITHEEISSLHYEYDMDQQELRSQLTITPLVRTVLSDSYDVRQCHTNTTSLVFLNFDVYFLVFLAYPKDIGCFVEARFSPSDPRMFVRKLPVRICCSAKCPNRPVVDILEENRGPLPISSTFSLNSFEYRYDFNEEAPE